MRKSYWVSTIIIILALSAAACENGTTSTDSKPKVTNGDIETAIKAKWNVDPTLKSADLSVSADADANTATVSGTVETESARTKAVDLARSAHRGLVVTDKIDVKPRQLTRAEYTEEAAQSEREKAKGMGERLGDSLDDAWIHTKIVAQLIGDADTPQRKINVDVVNNTVTLRGAVNSPEQKAEAERIAKSTEGVKKVINQLKVDKNA
jgi:osmotically-inducible protein OsmY